MDLSPAIGCRQEELQCGSAPAVPHDLSQHPQSPVSLPTSGLDRSLGHRRPFAHLFGTVPDPAERLPFPIPIMSRLHT